MVKTHALLSRVAESYIIPHRVTVSIGKANLQLTKVNFIQTSAFLKGKVSLYSSPKSAENCFILSFVRTDFTFDP